MTAPLALHYAVFDCTKPAGVTVYMRTVKGARLAAQLLSGLTGRTHDYAGDLIGETDTLAPTIAAAGRLALQIAAASAFIAVIILALVAFTPR